MLADVPVPCTGRPAPANLLRREDEVLQKQRWKQSSCGAERKAGSKEQPTAAS